MIANTVSGVLIINVVFWPQSPIPIMKAPIFVRDPRLACPSCESVYLSEGMEPESRVSAWTR